MYKYDFFWGKISYNNYNYNNSNVFNRRLRYCVHLNQPARQQKR